MPQDYSDDNPSTERVETRSSERARGERSRTEKSAATASEQLTEMRDDLREAGAKNLTAGLHMQREMFDAFQHLGREWLERATAEAELAFKLPAKLTAARTVPDAFSVYQEWLGEWMNKCGEDGRHFIADGQKIINAGARCLSGGSPAVTS